MSTDNGGHWSSGLYVCAGIVKDIAVKPAGFDLTLFMAEDGVSFCNCGGLYRSTDYGTSWGRCHRYDSDTGFTSLAVLGNEIFSGTRGAGVLRSTDHGFTWMPVNDSLPSYVDALCVSGTDIYALCGSLYRSGNNGANWTSVGPPLGPGTNVSAFAALGTTLYCAAVHRGFLGGTVFRSTNNGATWDTVTNSMVTAFAVSNSNIFASVFEGGVHLSTDSGKSWTAVNTGLPDADIRTLAINETHLFAAIDSVVWRRPLADMITSAEIHSSRSPLSIELCQNYPNPFNPATVIRYSLPVRSRVVLMVSNALGQEIAVLQNGEEDAGNHEVRFDARGLSSGLYFYRLQTENHVLTRTMLLLR
jgi:photosystem II stability/assembly factor-like uncharacterized protein